jgi:hypothetical protein
MLESVPTGTVSLSFPATTIRASSPGRAQTSCDPRCRITSQPASFSAVRTLGSSWPRSEARRSAGHPHIGAAGELFRVHHIREPAVHKRPKYGHKRLRKYLPLSKYQHKIPANSRCRRRGSNPRHADYDCGCPYRLSPVNTGDSGPRKPIWTGLPAGLRTLEPLRVAGASSGS